MDARGIMAMNAPLRISSLVYEKRPYIDTVKIYLRRPISSDELAALRGMARSCLKLGPMPHQMFNWPEGIALQRPKDEAFEFIATNFEDALVCRVDLALDLITATRYEANLVQEYVDRHLVQRWRGKKKVGRCKGTTYAGRANSRNNIARYSDLPSKLDGRPCCHIEWKINSAQAVTAAKLGSLIDLVNVDHRDFWKEHLMLRAYPVGASALENLGKSYRGQPKRKKPWLMRYGPRLVMNWHLRLGGLIVRSADSAQEVLDRFGPVVQRHFPLLPIDWMLPEAPA